MSKIATVRKKQMEKNDPLVQKIAEEACLDPQYVEMMNCIETDTNYKDIDPECELKKMNDIMSRLSIVTLDTCDSERRDLYINSEGDEETDGRYSSLFSRS